MTEEAARTALLQFVNSKCCYGNRAAGELVIQELRQLAIYRYRLETFRESRLSEWAFEPLPKPGAAGRPRGASAPPAMFREGTRRVRVPHSCRVKDCHRCHGHGRSKCSVCHGAGRTRCVTCKGSRRRLKQQKRCQLCSGTGRKRKNNVFEFVSEHQLDFPGELLSKVNGETVFRDENVQVYPITDFPEPAISLASQRAIAEHNATSAASSRILQQRQTVELIPITEVRYEHAGQPRLYYVYGLENEVYARDYPQRCCCRCSIA